jgi:hypothetical protein
VNGIGVKRTRSGLKSRWIAAVAFAALLAGAPCARSQPSGQIVEAEKAAQSVSQTPAAASENEPKPFPLPFLGEAARKRGVELPLPFGVGLVYYNLHRAIKITDVRVGRNGVPPASVSQFAQFASSANVNNLNLKADVWLFPFLNLYAIVGGVWNKSTTNIDVTLPPLRPAGSPRQGRIAVPAELDGSVGGLGLTLAAGYGALFAAADFNAARADLGFNDKFKAVITSLRAGWNGKLDSRPLRIWLNGTYWDTFTEAKGTVTDSDGGTLSFEVDQGPLHPYTYGAGLSYGLSRRMDLSTDFGTDFHGGWYVALVPVYRF